MTLIPRKPLGIVRKELEVDNSRTKFEEWELLFLIGNLKHRNIIEILAAYSHNGFTNLLLEKADFDLSKFMTMVPRPSSFRENWRIFKAFQGLSSGLSHLHEFRLSSMGPQEPQRTSMKGYHHDLKPQNVLVRGTDFVLTDFGLSRLKELDQDSNTPWKHGTFAYGAPECRDPKTLESGELGRAADIWSIGCILLEATVYAEHGPDEVNKFKADRCVQSEYGKVEAFHHDRKPHSVVEAQMERLETSERKENDLRAVCRLVRDTLSLQPLDRPKAEQVETRVARITIQSLLSELFYNITCISQTCDTTESKMFLTRIHLENHRLRSWCAVLGLISIAGGPDESSELPVPSFEDSCVEIESAISATSSIPVGVSEDVMDRLSHQDSIVATLYQLNNRLYGFLPHIQRADANSLFAVLTTDVKNPDLLSAISDEALRRGSSNYEKVGIMAAMKYMALLYERDAAAGDASRPLDPLLIEKDSHKEDEQTRPQTYWYLHGLGDAEKEKVIVEWKGYGEKWTTKDIHSEEFKHAGEAMFLRVRNLVAMFQTQQKSGDSHTLHCIGAFHRPEERRFGIVYQFPSQECFPVRLQRLLRNKKKRTDSSPPDLEVKVQLAKALVSAVKHFHMSGWLHKNFTSFNVLFFHNSPDRWSNVDYGSPYIVGFRQSRQDQPNAYTEGIANDTEEEYQHPSYRNRQRNAPFKKSFDLYSLGLVLLEIGIWAALCEVYESQEHRTASPAQLKDTYVKLCEKPLRGIMGSFYSRATKACLEAEEKVEESSEDAQLYFEREVVERLERVAV